MGGSTWAKARAANEFQNRSSSRHRPIRSACSQEAAKIELKSTVTHQQNGANGISDIEGKVAREAMSECEQRTSFKAMEVLTAQRQEEAAQIQRMSAQLTAASPSRAGLD